MDDQKRCRDCGKPINKDQQENFFSLCSNCFRDYESSQIGKATAMRVIGIILLIFVSISSFAYTRFIYIPKPLGVILYSIGYTIALIIPTLLIVFGTKKIKYWNKEFKAKPLETGHVMVNSSSNSAQDRKLFCPECGSERVELNQKFCINCGTEI